MKPRVVIVGAGFAGLYAARVLRSAPVDVTVIDRTNHRLSVLLQWGYAYFTYERGVRLITRTEAKRAARG